MIIKTGMKGKPNESLQMINDEFGVSGNCVTREKK